jgi:hypothetical protein
MHSATLAAPVSKGRLWTARSLSGLVVLFMLFDAVSHVLKPAPVVDAFARLGVPQNLSAGIGLLAVVCTVLYAVRRTSLLGAILLTAYLGGATAIQVRAGAALFPVLFPAILGVLLWAGLVLRDPRLRATLVARDLNISGD